MATVKEFYDSVTKLKIEVGATDEEIDQYLPAVLNDRMEKYSKRLANKYPLSLQKKAMDYFNSLSPMEQSETGEHIETILEDAIVANPGDFTAEEIGSIFGKDGHRKPLTPGIYDTPIRDYDRAKYQNEDILVEESPKIAPQVEPTISIEQARSMDLDKLRSMLPEVEESDE